jgi:hypothetical protein
MQSAKPEYITRAEFHEAMNAMRDRIGTGYLKLADKLEQHQTALLTALDRQGANLERRLDTLEASLARIPHSALGTPRLAHSALKST